MNSICGRPFAHQQLIQYEIAIASKHIHTNYTNMKDINQGWWKFFGPFDAQKNIIETTNEI